MAATDELASLIKRIQFEFDDLHNYYEHTTTVWLTFQKSADEGHKFEAENIATKLKYTEQDLIALSGYYMTTNLVPFVLQRCCSTFETFLFDFLRILMFTNPGLLGNKPLTLGEVLKAGAIAPLVSDAIEEKLHKLRYEKPKDWFDFAEFIMRLGCPTADEIERFAEIKATRDVLEHNSGIVSRIYVGKAGAKARFTEGESVDVPDLYLRESWELLKKISADLTQTAIKLLQLRK